MKQNWKQFPILVKATALKQQIAEFCLQSSVLIFDLEMVLLSQDSRQWPF